MFPAFTLGYLLATLARSALASLGTSSAAALRYLAPGACAVALTLATLAALTYETSYTDASGARCTSFQIGHHEADMCHGRDDRPAPMPPAWPIDWTPEAATAAAKGGAR